VEIIIIGTSPDKLVVQEAVRDWCMKPYPGHPRGCPNYGRRGCCPPAAPMLGEFFDLSKSVCFVIAKFDLAEHAADMRRRHPHLSERQARCCLYWQNRVRKELRKATCKLMVHSGYSAITDIPEAMGLNLFRTMHNLGFKLERNPKQYVHKIAMLGATKVGP
jgi:predicted metal-binding protein